MSASTARTAVVVVQSTVIRNDPEARAAGSVERRLAAIRAQISFSLLRH